MAAAGRQEASRLETRRLILDAAYALFEEKGYSKTTMRELASRAGVGLGTIFQHFSDKACLLVEAFDTDVAEVVQAAFASLPPHDVCTQLTHLARALYGLYGERPQLSLQVFAQVYQTDGPAAKKLMGQMTEFVGRIAALYEAAKARGEIKQNVDANDAALVFWSCYVACLANWLWSGASDIEQPIAQLDRLLHQHLTGIAV